jgi:flavin-dependent dehydrogenase
MSRIFFARALACACIAGTTAFGASVPKEPEVLAEADVVVVGGTSAGVAAALAARKAGASVYLVAPRPYLGEDLAGKLRIRNDGTLWKSKNPLVTAMRLAFGTPAAMFGDITPLRIKRLFDEALLGAKIPFTTWTAACDVLLDADGGIAGVVTANRSGVKIVRAKAVVDATERAHVARRAGARFAPYNAGAHRFSREIIAAEPPPDVPGLSVNEWPGVHTIKTRGPKMAKDQPTVVTGRMYTCTMTIDMPDGSARSFAAAEQKARDLTWSPTTLDASDTLFEPPPDELLDAPANVFVCGRKAGVGENFADGERAGAEAAAAAKKRGEAMPAYVWKEAPLPVIAECDVFVAGAGTGGAPAAIAAARSGARTIVCDYLHRMGGVMTDGVIGQYCWGYRKGFTAELDESLKSFGAVYGVAKAEWFRAECRKAGAEIWFGALVVDVVKDGDAVKGVVCVMPDGSRGIVRCKTAVDASGNADLAAAAGEPTEFINGEELSLQGVGSTPKVLGASYQNTDVGFVDDTDAADLAFFTLRARCNFGDYAWDQSQVVNSRERRRMHGAFYVTVQDAMNGRTYPDVIGITLSNFDTHGQTVDPQFFIEDPGRKGTMVYLPYRAILPQKTEGLLVIGLGMSAHRDAMPILRMQPDVQNQGYAAGLAAAMAVKAGVPPRAIDVAALQKALVAKDIIPAEAAEMKDNFPFSDERLADAVRTIPDDYRGLSIVLTDVKRAHPLLSEGYRSAKSAESPAAALAYAHVLGLLGDASGAADVAAKLDSMEWDKGWNYRGMDQFGRSVSWADSYLIALGRSRGAAGFDAAVRKAKTLSPAQEYSHFRAVALAFEGLGDRRAAPVLRDLLLMPGVGGHFLTPAEGPAARIPNYDRFTTRNLGAGDMERSLCLRELCLARALWRLGDADGLAEKTLRAYAADPRRAYANHARMVLEGK